MKAVRIHQRGGPEVMKLEEIALPTPGPNEILIKVAAAGVNYADLGQRRGDYPNLAPLPATLGSEVAGIVFERGAGVMAPAVGERVVALVEGGYAEYALAPAAQVMTIPDGVSFAQATVVPIQGETAYLLLNKAARLQPGERVLIHAAAGGVGQLALQLARLLGAGMIIGTVRAEEKLGYIRACGADLAVNTANPGWVDQVMGATSGQGVDVILDAVGGPLTQPNIACLAPFGRLIVFGVLSGAVPIVPPMLIARCLSVSGYNTLIQPATDQLGGGRALLDYIANGQLQVTLAHSYALSESAAAHQAIEAGRTQGKVVLTVLFIQLQ